MLIETGTPQITVSGASIRCSSGLMDRAAAERSQPRRCI
jgi:hypothetical protein